MKKTQTLQRTVINTDGEILQDERSFTIEYDQEPDYIKLYLKDLFYIKDLPKRHENILFQLLNYVTYADENKMYITTSKFMKESIMETLDIKNIRTINNALLDLSKSNILIHRAHSTYQLNPYFFGKGKWKDISNLRLEVNYDMIKGRTYKTNIEYKYKSSRPEEEPIRQAM